MTDRPTPETNICQLDNFEKVKGFSESSYYAAIELCRKLERERDEARDLARELRDALHKTLVSFVPVMEAEDWYPVEEAHRTLTKAKEVLG